MLREKLFRKLMATLMISLLIFGLAELDSRWKRLEAIQGYAQLDNRAIYDQTGISTYQRVVLLMQDLEGSNLLLSSRKSLR